MAKIGVTCLDCTADNPVQARAVLATVDLGEFHEPLGRLSWACLSCSHLVTTEVDVENLLRLLAAGVPLLDDDFGGSTLAEEYTDSAVPTQLHPRGPGRRRTVHSPGHLDSARAARDRGVGSSNSPNDRAAAHDRTPPTLDPSGDCLVPRGDLAGRVLHGSIPVETQGMTRARIRTKEHILDLVRAAAPRRADNRSQNRPKCL